MQAPPTPPPGFTLAPIEIVVGQDTILCYRIQPVLDRDLKAFADFLEWLRDVVINDLIVLLPQRLEPFGTGEDRGIQALVDSIAQSAAVLLSDAHVAAPAQDVAVLLGSGDAIDYVVSYMPTQLEPSRIFRSWARQTDYAQFSRLWTSASWDDDDGLDLKARNYALERPIFVSDLGRAMAELHNHGFLRVDSHEGNWAFDITASGPRLSAFDLANMRYLYPPADPVASATDLIPLMTSFSTSDWAHFRQGYLAERPGDGLLVMAVIQRGDLTGWSVAFDNEDYPESLRLVEKALAREDSPGGRLRLQGFQATLLSRLGRHQEAIAAHEKTLSLDADPDRESLNRFNLAQALVRAGQSQAGRTQLEMVLALPKHLDERIPEAARAVLAELPAEP
jgi:tetratricopeptide (TPR) repeat protein